MISAYEIPSYIICKVCGSAMLNVTEYSKDLPIGKTAYMCVRSGCKQAGQAYWHHYKEVTLHDKVEPRN